MTDPARCKHGMLWGTCGLCLVAGEEIEIHRAATRLVERCERIMELQAEENAMNMGKMVCKLGEECVNGIDPQPIDNFQKSAKTKSGRLYTCRSCMKVAIYKGRRNKRPGSDASRETAGKKVPTDCGKLELTIDLTGRESLFEQLQEGAKKDFRTPEQQALFCVFCHLKKTDGGGSP